MEHEHKDFISDFRRFFGKGLAIVLPTVLTLWILVQAYFFVDSRVAQPINRGIRAGILWVMPNFVEDDKGPEWFSVGPKEIAKRRETLKSATDQQIVRAIRLDQFRDFWNGEWYFRFIGLLVAMVIIYLAGVLLGGFIGRRVYRNLESFLTRLPVFNFIYPHVKQMVDLILGERPMAFRRVVMVQYPRKGIYTVGFVTSESLPAAKRFAGGDVLAIFIPSTPMPFTGFTITIRKDETIDLPLSVDEAIRFFITGGVLVPERPEGGSAHTMSGEDPPDKGKKP